jgi:hypothetical protein
VGRHVSYGRKRSLRGRFFLALVGIVALIGVAAFAAHRIWDHSHDRSHDHSPRQRQAAPAAPPGERVTSAGWKS